MAKHFDELRERLLLAGVAPRHVARYLAELRDHFADLRAEEELVGSSRTNAESAALVRLGGLDELVKAMTKQPQFQSWCVRVPWVTFGLAPLLILAGAWFVSVLISLSGFNAPVSRAYALALRDIRIGGLIFFASPILIGWGIGLFAARQRCKPAWPTASLIAITLVGSTLRVYFDGFAFALVPGGGMRFGGIGFAGTSDALLDALLILLMTVLPYALGRLKRLRSAR